MKRINLFAIAILTFPLLGISSNGFSQTNESGPMALQAKPSPRESGNTNSNMKPDGDPDGKLDGKPDGKLDGKPNGKPDKVAKGDKSGFRPDNREGKHKSGNNQDIKNGKNHRKPNQNPDWAGNGPADPRVMSGTRFDPRTPVRRTFQNFQFLKDNDPDLYKLIQADIEFEKSLRELAKKYKNAKEDKQKENIRLEIEEQAEKHFWVRQQKRELELERMKSWLEQLEGQVKKSRNNSRFIIDRRINQLLGNDLGEF